MANNIADAPASSQPEILEPGEDFGCETLDDGEYGVREGDVVIYGAPATFRSFCESILSRIPTPTEGTHEQRLQAAVAEAEPLFWAVITAHFPEVKTGDFGPGDAGALMFALEDAVRTWLVYNHPDNVRERELADQAEMRAAGLPAVVGDTDVRRLVGAGYPGAVLVYPGGSASPGDSTDGFVVMPEADAVSTGYHVFGRAADVLVSHGPAPLSDEAAHAAAAEIAERLWPVGTHEAKCGRCDETFNPAGPHDLLHVQRADGGQCGGTGVYQGTSRF